VASVPVHHGEILQGVFLHGQRLVRGLVTLPCAMYHQRATFTPGGRDPVEVVPHWKYKARAAAELTLLTLDLPRGGWLELCGAVPLGRGFGSSTSDVLAAINAVGDAYEVPVPLQTAAKIAVRAELASDSLMFDDGAVLFAQRAGEVLEDFGNRLPPMRVLGFGNRTATNGNGNGVDTLALPPARYDQREIGIFTELRVMLREAIATKDVTLLGCVATASTRLNQRHLPIPAFERILGIVAEIGAAGIQTAHSGNIAGILLDWNHPDVDARLERARHLLRDIGIVEQWEFTTDD